MTKTSLALIATTVAADGVRRLARSDCAAVHLALQAKENAVALCPAGDEVAVKYALAAGIPTIRELEASLVTDFQLAYVGTGFAEFVGDICLARWAEKSKASLLFEVIRCSALPEAARCVECDAGRGARHLLSVRGPLIMVLSSHIPRPAYVSRYRRQSVSLQLSRDHSLAHDQLASQPQARDWSPVRPRVRTRPAQDSPAAADDRLNDAFSIRVGGHTKSSNVIIADAESCARHLLRYLSHHSFVTRAESDDRLEMAVVSHASTEPCVTGSVSQKVNLVSLGAFMERRPRQANDSTARRARQPRPTARA
jgi:hypothetical protein